MLYPLPDASLISHQGKPVALRQMKGRVAVYDFIFTSCGGACPLMTRAMQQLVGDFKPDEKIQFVSISVDPKHDTPAVLSDYAKKWTSDGRWLFLTGDLDTISALAVKGFKLAATQPGAGAEALLHSSKFVLVDKTGFVRGYYDSTEHSALTSLQADARALIQE